MVAMAHHPAIQKEVDDMLAKSVIDPSTGHSGFTQMYIWSLSALVAYDPYSILTTSL